MEENNPANANKIPDPRARQPFNIRFSITKIFKITAGVLVVLFIGTIVLSFLVGRQTSDKSDVRSESKDEKISESSKQSNKPIEADASSSRKKIIAFVKTNENRQYELVLYDFGERKNIKTALQPSDVVNANLILGHWSPDGKVLPILSFSSVGNKAMPALYFYNVVSNTVKTVQLVDVFDRKRDESLREDINLTWRDNENLILRRTKKNITNDTTVTYVSKSGNITEKTGKYIHIVKNSMLEAEFSVDSSHIADESDIQKYVFKVDNHKYAITSGGSVLGIVDGKAVFLYEDWNFNTKLYFVDLDSGILTDTINVTNGGKWYSTGNFIVPDMSEIMIHQMSDENEDFTMEKERVLVYNINTKNISVFISQPVTSRDNTWLEQVGPAGNVDTILATEDYKWILKFESNNGQPPFNKRIVMINLSTKEKITICEGYCSNLRVYNPDRPYYSIRELP